MAGGDGELLEEQAAFYEADAASFDGWLGELIDETNVAPTAQTYRAGRARIAEAFGQRAPLGDVLEVASGGGRLAELYARHADRIVLVDSSRASLDLAVARLAPLHDAADVVEADVFAWDDGGGRFDTIVFTAWLHHVPHSRFTEFWGKVDSLLRPSGRVVFDFPDPNLESPARDEVPAEPTEGYGYYAPVDGVSIRDHFGRRWRVVHNLWDPGDLAARLAELGWSMRLIGPGLFDDVHWAEARRT